MLPLLNDPEKDCYEFVVIEPKLFSIGAIGTLASNVALFKRSKFLRNTEYRSLVTLSPVAISLMKAISF